MGTNASHGLFTRYNDKLVDYVVHITETYPGGDTKRTTWVITAYNATMANDIAKRYASQHHGEVTKKAEKVSNMRSSKGAGEMHVLK